MLTIEAMAVIFAVIMILMAGGIMLWWLSEQERLLEKSMEEKAVAQIVGESDGSR
jgi:flagellar biosynthesis/type III secretory pathway M-ring protein FliF/YscJ